MASTRPPSLPVLVLPDMGSGDINPFEPAPDIPPQSAMRRGARTRRDSNSAPQHPIPVMQGAFEESLWEATKSDAPEKPKLRIGDAKYRRGLLVDQNEAARHLESEYALWRKRPGQKYHELWKLAAQISFGVYLLLTGQANNDRQVVGILQGHIDDVDEFLEVTMEDLEYAMEDLTDRMALLRLPMENMDVFERMLEDRNFRYQIVSGNEKIEKILTLTRRCLEETVKDIAEGLDATREFSIYLAKQKEGSWRTTRPRVIDIFNAMNGNTEGWFNALMELQSKSKSLDNLVSKLSGIISEMDRKAGEVSRRTRFSIAPFSPSGTDPRSGDTTPRASLMSQSTIRPRSKSAKSTTSTILSPRESIARRMSGSSANYADIATRNEGASNHHSKMPPRSVPGAVAESMEENDDWEEASDAGTRRAGGEAESNDDNEEEGGGDDLTADDGPMYILQPRTYTPQPPAPLPSPMNANHPQRSASPDRTPRDAEPRQKRLSLRDRVSQKVQPPESIQVPPPNAIDFQHAARHRASPRPAGTFPAPDSAYGSDVERRPTINSVVTDSSIPEMSPPIFHPGLMPSPRSDQQRYFPVQASPHSPLQQRPWTAGDLSRDQPNPPSHGARSGGHVRNKPSQMNMSMLSNVTSASDLRSENGKSIAASGQLKKKRSAFGWLRKAFSLDEEERAQFEMRKHQTFHNPYMESRSPRFLDGKRIQ